MKKVILVPVLALLTACGGGGGGSDIDSETGTISISSTGSDSIIDEQGEYNLTISGIGNDLIIKEGNKINRLKISGTGNDVIIEPNTTVKTFTISGTGNDIFVPVDSGISFTDSGTGNDLITLTTNSIVGNWSYTYPITQCVETYQFNADGTFNETALDEVAAGTYSLEKTVITGDRHELSLSITSDNGLPDCSGSSEDSTGLTFSTYLNFISISAIEVFDEETGGNSDTTLIKQ